MASEPGGDSSARYFVAKCRSMDSLRRCVTRKTWASRERVLPPQPHDVLISALSQGPVVLIFSVNNCHGWHGYCQMASTPKSGASGAIFVKDDAGVLSRQEGISRESTEQTDATGKVEDDVCQYVVNANSNETENIPHQKGQSSDLSNSAESDAWHYFEVNWQTEFISQFGETCLPSSKTNDMLLCDGSPLNKARNWQEMPSGVGELVVSLIDEMHAGLVEKRRQAEEAKLAARPPPFMQMEGDVQEGAERYWRLIVEKVERELGCVHLACPFGSQRYNLQQPDSDIDAFIVYQAHTKDLLGFNPPKMTVKNSDRETCDYTVLELKRYCELLLAYDARCIETLFLHNSTIIKASPKWQQLQKLRQQFLTKKCFDKYLGDALGSNGVMKLHRLLENSPVKGDEPPPPKVAKLAYIIVRLLLNALDIIKGRPLDVFRSPGSKERDILLKIRERNITIDEIKAIIQGLQEDIEQGKDSLKQELPDVTKDLESWLLSLRYQDILAYPPLEDNL